MKIQRLRSQIERTLRVALAFQVPKRIVRARSTGDGSKSTSPYVPSPLGRLLHFRKQYVRCQKRLAGSQVSRARTRSRLVHKLPHPLRRQRRRRGWGSTGILAVAVSSLRNSFTSETSSPGSQESVKAPWARAG